ncbi:MAG: hypothetical protein RL653_778 [Pseudomonadota bacterium]|jgi:uncharacterized protein with NRDE domain
MCTLLAAVQRHPRYPLLVAANRDERLDRPASGPLEWRSGPLPFVAPRDEVAGGTWVGLNAAGLFVAVTNRFGAPRDDSRRSRGALVVEVLGQRSAEALHAWMARLEPRAFNPFHLLYADAQHAFVTWTDGTTLTQQGLGPGLHVVTEQSFREEPVARARALTAGFEGLPDCASPGGLFSLLRRHDEGDPFAGTCIHAPSFHYGTRSSTVVMLGRDAADTRFYASEGPAHAGTLVEHPVPRA